jgi:hypothetical protein
VITTLNSLPADAIAQRASYRDTKNGAPTDPAKRYGLVTVSLAGADGNARLANFEPIEMPSPSRGPLMIMTMAGAVPIVVPSSGDCSATLSGR